MPRTVLSAVLLLLAAATPARAWNDKGHMVVARLAWKELTPDERAKVVALLRTHPHAAEFLAADKPAGFSEDEWVFLRAGTWADWIRSGPAERTKYHEGPSHYVNVPFFPGKPVPLPAPAPVTVITRIESSVRGASSGGDRVKRAVELTWVFHLIGDVHQPLHCATLFGEAFPQGDRGGNKSLARVEGRVIQLHAFWDGLLGRGTTPAEINGTLREAEAAWAAQPADAKADEAKHATAAEWVQEGFESAKRFAYLDGKLQPADSDKNPPAAQIPEVGKGYAADAGKVAHLAAARAGKRLAAALRDIAAAN